METKKKLTGYPSIDKPWLKYYPDEVINAELPTGTIYEYLWENNKNYPNDTALIYFGKNITYGELFENIEATAKALVSVGVKANDIVTVALPTIPEALYLVYAINKLGATANMIHPLAGENEIVNYLNEVKATHFFMFYGTYEIVKNALDKTTVKTGVVVSVAESLPLGIKLLYKLKAKEKTSFSNTDLICWSKFLKKGNGAIIPSYKKEPSTPAIISHTGGTTGEPKGVVLSDISTNTLIWEIGCNLPHERQEIMMPVLPPFVNYSLVNCMLEPLAFGFKVVLIPKYEPDKFDEYINKYHPNHINSIPAYWEALLSNERMKETDCSCLCHIFYGGEGMNEKIEESVNELLLSRGAKYKLAKGLGSTEMVSAATAAYQDCNLLGSVGIPLVKVNCKIIDPDTKKELLCNQEGEICFSGPQLMIGYYENKEATDDIIKIHQDGERWLHTGDLGYLNEDGVLFVSGRIKRIIMTKGKDGVVTKMFPDRIEKVIMEHPAVELCCAIGVADEHRINYARVYVVMATSYSQNENITNEILSDCHKKLPEYMVPEEIIYRKELPRTDRGKVDYRALEKEADQL